MPIFNRSALEYILCRTEEDNYVKLEGKALLRLPKGEGGVIATPNKVVVFGGHTPLKPGKSEIVRAAESLLPGSIGDQVAMAILCAQAIDALFERPIGKAARAIIRPTADGEVDLEHIEVEWLASC